MNQKRRDYILLGTLIAFFGIILLLFQIFAYKGEAKSAYVFFGSNTHLIEVDFEKREYKINEQGLIQYKDFFKTDSYPIIEDDYITLLGMYKRDGEHQEVVIKVDMDKRSLRITKEQSPLNICSKQGESNGRPLVCLPNNIFIYFDAKEKNLEI